MTEVAALGLRVSGVADIDSASSSLDRFTKSSKSADQASGSLTTESRNTSKSLADVAREGDKSSTSMSKLAGAAKLAAGAFAGIKLTTLISDITMANSRFEQLGLVMGVVGRNASLSQDQVNAYAKEVEAMGISMTESRQTVIKMISAQMDLSRASELARLAQDAAVIANTNSSDALGRLVYGLQSGQVEILRNMGLNVNFAKSYEELAKQLGIATDQLTEADRIQARTNATMAAGIGIAGAYDASMENAGKQLGSTTRYLQDLGVMWGEVFSKAATDAIFGYSDALKALHASSKELRDDGTLVAWSENLAGAMRIAIDVAALLAIAVGARLASSLYAAAAAAARYTAAAGAATLGSQSLAVAARGASAAMALVGGPAGAIILAAGALLYFSTRASEAEKESEALDNRINKLNGSFNNLNADQAAAAILDYDTKLASATLTMQAAEARVFTLNRNLERFPNSKKAEEWATDLVRAKGAVGDAADEVSSLNSMLSQLNGIVQQGGVKDLEDDTDKASEAFSRLNIQLKERLALVGLSTEAERLAARVSGGYVEGLLDGEGELLVALQRRIDAALESDNASQAAAAAAKQHQEVMKSAFDGAVDGYHRQLTLADDATEAEQLLYEVQYGRLQGLLPAQAKMLEGMARELDMRNHLAQIDEDEKKLSGERDDITRQLMTEEEAILASYARRRDIVLAATFENEQARTELLLRLEEERNEALIEANGSYWERWLLAAEENLTSFDEIAGQTIEQFTRGFGDAFESAIFDAEDFGEAVQGIMQSMARGVVNAIGQMIAQEMALVAVQRLRGEVAEKSALMEIAAIAKTKAASLAATAQTVAAQVAAAASSFAAWLPAAIASSIGSFGAAAAIGLAAVTAAVALTGGFKDGGYTGNGGVNDIAGVVHGKEYVFDAASTARIGVDNLEAMRSGRAMPGNVVPFPTAAARAPSVGGLNLTINNNVRGVDVVASETTGENGDPQYIIDIVSRDMVNGGQTADAVASITGTQYQGS